MLEPSSDKIDDLKKLYTSSKSIVIFLAKDSSFDGIAAGLSLYLAFKKAQKEVSIYCSTPTVVENANLVAIDKIQNSIGNKNLVISFDYVDGAIDRVSYNIEGDKFKLVIQPKEGKSALSSNKVAYSYSGLAADLVFTIDAKNLNDLGEVALKESEFFQKTKIVNISLRQNGKFASLNVATPGVFSLSELALSLFSSLSLQIDQDIATNILMGIEYASTSFSDPRLDATTFETVAYLLKQGAKRQKVPAFKQKEETKETKEAPKAEEKRPAVKNEAPADWLQPKIYKGGQLT